MAELEAALEEVGLSPASIDQVVEELGEVATVENVDETAALLADVEQFVADDNASYEDVMNASYEEPSGFLNESVESDFGSESEY